MVWLVGYLLNDTLSTVDGI